MACPDRPKGQDSKIATWSRRSFFNSPSTKWDERGDDTRRMFDKIKGLSFDKDQGERGFMRLSGGIPRTKTEIVQRDKEAQEERISYGRNDYLLSVCQLV